MMPRNGGVNMAKKVQQSWPHTEDELWVILLDYCQELGRVPSRRNLQKYNLVKADELLVVLGKGQGWPKIEMELKRRFEVAFGKTESVQLAGDPENERDVVTDVEQVEDNFDAQGLPKLEVVKRGRKPKYNEEELLILLRLAYASCDAQMPKRVDINRLHQTNPETFPTYSTFVKYLGDLDTWEAKMKST